LPQHGAALAPPVSAGCPGFERAHEALRGSDCV